MAAPLTVVITSFNRERFIGQSIESVLNSDFRDFELLIVDDASDDATVDIARGYARHDRRIRICVNERNLGDYPNRNRAIGLVATPYLKFHDSDDVMYPHCLGVLMRLLREEPRAGFALSSSRSWPGKPCPIYVTPRDAYLREYLGQGMFFGGPATALFRLEALRQLGGFPERGAGSDFVFWLTACARVPALLVPADLFWYRVHSGQELSSSSAPRDYAVAQAEAWKALLSPECPLAGDELVAAKRACLRRFLKLTWRDLKAVRLGLSTLRLRSAGVRWSDWLRYRPRLRARVENDPAPKEGSEVLARWGRFERAPQEEELKTTLRGRVGRR